MSMIDNLSGVDNLLNGMNLEELLRKKLEKDPLEEILNPDPAKLLEQTQEQAASASKDTLTVSAASLEAAGLLKEFNTARDYAQTALEAKRMDEEMAMDALATEFNVLDYMNEEMRDAVLDAAARGARKKNDDVYAASEQTVSETKKDIDRAAEEAAAPKDADGNPIELPGQSAAGATDAAGPAPSPAPQVSAAASAAAAVDVEMDAASAAPVRVAPKLNITV